MAPLATSDREALAGGAASTGRVLGSLTIPGRPEHVRAARAFVADSLSGHPATEVAVLLASETVTNAVLHSNSRHRGGTVTITVLRRGAELRVEVADAGSDLTIPVVKGDGCSPGGHGLYLVQTLACDWGYLRNGSGTVVWFSVPLG
jgi:anti-sigma regulatory factor (Ser/Thr protein kinase)